MVYFDSDDNIARFCMQGIEVYTLEERSMTSYLHSKKELSSGHKLEYWSILKRQTPDDYSTVLRAGNRSIHTR
jgi:hypothetical protein